VGLFVRLIVALRVCYHDNSKLRISIFTKLEGGLQRGEIFGSALLHAVLGVCVSLVNENSLPKRLTENF